MLRLLCVEKTNRYISLLSISFLLFSISNFSFAQNQDRVRAGEVIPQPPTLRSLGVEWHIEGDANRNASVELSYREVGSEWRQGLTPFRLQNEMVPAENATDRGLNANRPAEQSAFYYIAPNLFVANLFNLKPDTSYEVRLKIEDPDGVRGRAERTLTLATRSVPQPSNEGNVYHVYPVGWQGEKQQPAYEGLLRAYNYGAEHADWNHAYEARVRPGDTLLIHAGVYKADRWEYGNYNLTGPGEGGPGYGVPFDGTYLLTGKGTKEKPITIKAAGDGEVWFDGDGNDVLFNVMVADYHLFDGINIRNTRVAYLAGIKRIAGAKGLTIVNSTIEDVGAAVETDYAGSRDFYIADNVLIGRVNPDYLVGWSRNPVWAEVPGWPADLSSFQGIRLYGPGHVVEHNRIERFHDGITLATYGRPDSLPELNPSAQQLARWELDGDYVTGPNSVDIMYNDISNISDVCIEPDGGARSIRVMYNRCFNIAGSNAIRSQPSFGGPHYYIGNLVYHLPAGSAIGASANGSGEVAIHNTVFGGISLGGANHHSLNNLIISTNANNPIASMQTFTNYSSSDFNGFVPMNSQQLYFRWISPPFNQVSNYESDALVPRTYRSLGEYSSETGQDQNSRMLEMDAFAGIERPSPNPGVLYEAAEFNFALRAGSQAVDAARLLPGLNDGFVGEAPDLGALELGGQVPLYGPRADN